MGDQKTLTCRKLLDLTPLPSGFQMTLGISRKTSIGQRQSPIRHRAIGIDRGSLAKRLLRLTVVALIDERQALIEIKLGERFFAPNLKIDAPDTRLQRRALEDWLVRYVASGSPGVCFRIVIDQRVWKRQI